MDAIDTTYQNLPVVEGVRESIEKENETFDDVVEKGEALATVEEGSSFEELMSSMFEVAVESQDKITVEEKADVAFLTMDVMAEDVVSVVDSSADNFLEKNAKAEKLEVVNGNLPFKDEETVLEDIPFVEVELDIAEQGDALKGLKEIKVKDEKTSNEKSEEKTDDESNNSINQDSSIRGALSNQYKKIEKQKKDEIKREDKVEEKGEEQGFEVKPLQKQKKVQAKKLPVVVEDLRTLEQAKTADAGSASFGNDASSEEFSSYYRSSDANPTNAKEVSSLNEGRAVHTEGQFASILAEQIKASSAELVERGKIILRDGNVGEIRLQLKPAHLGNVKIQLKMSGDKKMQGEVTVSSKEAFDAFEESMQDLIASFNEAGFDASGFNLNWQGGEKEEIVREDLSNQYFSPEKTHLSLSERLNFADNVYGIDKAKRLNVLV